MLVDVDKATLNREVPQPNRHDLLGPFTTTFHGTNSINYTTDSTAANQVQAKSGFITISQKDSSVFEELNSNTTVGSGVGNFGSQTLTLLTIPHGLPYTPGIIPFVGTGDTFYAMPYSSVVVPGPTGTKAPFADWTNFWAAVDTTNIYFYCDVMATNTSIGIGPFPFTYYLTQQTPN